MIISRFFVKTTTDHDEWFDGTKCVLWTASNGTKNGYGRFNDGSRRFWVVHRFAWALVHGPVPDGMVVAHRCRNKLCVNHQHLELITFEEMISRRIAAFRPSPTFRCCGQPRTPENSYGSGRCKACQKAAMKRCAAKRKRRARDQARS